MAHYALPLDRTREEFYRSLGDTLAIAGRYGKQQADVVLDMPPRLRHSFLDGLRRLIDAEQRR